MALGLSSFDLLYIAASGYALLRGGAPERLCAVILIFDFQLSYLVIRPFAHRYQGVEVAVFIVDTLAFFGLYILSLLTTRFWPIWASALQGMVVIGHLSMLVPGMMPFVYGQFVQKWAYPLLVIMAVGTWRHRSRLAFGADHPWAWKRRPSHEP